MKNIKINMLPFLIFIICAFVIPTKAFAAVYDYSYTAYNCTGDKYDNAQACITSYWSGSLASISAGSSVEKGSYMMIVLNSKYDSTSSTPAGTLTLDSKYDNSYVTEQGDSDGVFSADALSTSNPAFTSRTIKNWTAQTNSTGSEFIALYSSTSSTLSYSTAAVPMAFMFFQVKSTATAGSTFTFTLDKSGTSLADANSLGIQWSVTPLSLMVAGASLSSDTSLSSLTATGSNSTQYALTPAFTSGTTTRDFTLTVPNSVTSLTLAGTTTDSNAQFISSKTSTLSSTTNLSVGSNTITFTVSAQNGDTSIYKVTVKRLSSDATLSSLSLTNGASISFASSTYSYNLTVPYATSSTTVSATTTNSSATIQSGTGTWNLSNYGSTINTKTITVNAEDCLSTYSSVSGNSCHTQTYTLNVTRTAPSTDSSLSGLTVGGTSISGFSSSIYNYSYGSVSNATSSVTIGATVTDTGKASITSGTGSQSLVVGDNTINVIVKAEDGTTSTYKITIHRKSADANLATLSITSTPSGTMSPSFTDPTFTGNYTYSYDSSVTSVTIAATANSSSATVSGNVGTYTDLANIAKITVTAEDGNTQTYTIKFSKILSTVNTIDTLTVTNSTLSPTFAKDTVYYTGAVDGTITSVDIGATLTDSKSSFVTDFGPRTVSLSYGANTFYVKVLSESGATNTYTLVITRNKKTIATLSSIKVDGTAISNFSSTSTKYILDDVSYATKSLTVTATTTDSDATYTVVGATSGVVNLSTGLNTIVVRGAAQDGTTTKDYTLEVTRAKNSDVNITSVKVLGIAANCSGNACTVTVPNSNSSVAPTDVVVTTNDSNATVTKQTSTVTLSTTNTNTFGFTVTAEDGTTKGTYTINITRTKSSDATLSALSVSDGSFSPSFTSSGTSYTVTVPATATSFTVSYTKTNSGASVTGAGTYTMSGSTQTVSVVVTAEDGTTKTYTLNIERIKSSVNTLSNLTVVNGSTTYTLSPTFAATTTSYTVTVPGTVTTVDIEGTLTDSNATITSGTGVKTLVVGNNTYTIRVTSESGSILDYTVVITRKKKSDNGLTDLAVDGTTITGFAKDTLTYTLANVAYSKNTIAITYTTSDSDATVTGAGTVNLATGANAISVVVTAQNGDKRTYVINVTRAKNNDATLKLLSITGTTLTPTFNANTLSYNATVSNSVSSLTSSMVTATATDSAATVTKTSSLSLSTSKTSDYTIVVTAEDGVTKNTYTITVTRNKSSDATLTSVTLTGATLNPTFVSSTTNYTVTVPYGSTTFTIAGTPTSSASTVTGGGTYSTSDSKVNLSVTAEDGTTKTYVFNIVAAKSNDATLTSLCISGDSMTPSFASTTLPYSIGNVTIGVQSLVVNATLSNSNSTIVYNVDGVTQSSNTVTLPQSLGQKTITVVVTAPDATTKKTYSITYTMVASSDAYLNSLVPSTGTITPTFSKGVNSYSITLPYETDSISFTAATEDDNASISTDATNYSYATTNSPKTFTFNNLIVGNNTLTFTVKAEDESINAYQVVVSRQAKVANTDAYLSSLSIDGYSLDQTFSKTNLNYTIGTIPYALSTITVNAVADYSASTITYYVDGVVQSSNVVNIAKKNGTYIIGVQVTAEDGVTVNNYQISYTKIASSDAYLSNIVDNLSKITSYSKTTLEYNIEVESTINTVTFTFTAEDSNASIMVGGTTHSSPYMYTTNALSVGNNTITIVVTAEDGTTLTYTININKIGTSEVITSNKYGHKITDGMITTVELNKTDKDIKDELDNDYSELQLWDASDSNELPDTTLAATGQIVKLIKNGSELDRKIVVVRGDDSGDGKVTLLDAVKIVNHYLGKISLSGAYLKAADTSQDSKITLLDAVKIVNHYLGKASLY